MTAAVIDGLNIPPLQWCVEGLIPEGFSLLVGGSKVGKSWAALDIGLAVASGNLALGYFKTTQGEVLYLALEDGPRLGCRKLYPVSARGSALSAPSF